MTRESATISCHFQITALRGFRYRIRHIRLKQRTATFTFCLRYAVAFHLATLHRAFRLHCLSKKDSTFPICFYGIEFQLGSTTFDKNLALGCTRCFRKDYGANYTRFFRRKSSKSASLFPTSFRSLFRILFQRAIFSPPYLATDRFQHLSRYLPFTIAIILRAFVIVFYGWNGARDVYFITVVALKSLPSPPEASSFFPYFSFSSVSFFIFSLACPFDSRLRFYAISCLT